MTCIPVYNVCKNWGKLELCICRGKIFVFFKILVMVKYANDYKKDNKFEHMI